jgi:PTS system arbutin-like IIC component
MSGNLKNRMSAFGSAMLGPVLLFPFFAILVSIIIVLNGYISPDSLMGQLLSVIESAGWTVFVYMPLLFVIGIPMRLANKANAQACLVSVISFLAFNTLLGSMAATWGANFGIDFAQEVGGTSGLAMVAGVKTLDTSIIGGICVGSIITFIHNRFYDKQLPEYLGIFQGPAFISMIGFIAMLPFAFFMLMVWPQIQHAIMSLQGVIIGSGTAGVGIYIFFEKLLLPTGLHHFIYGPFMYADVAVQGGTLKYWLTHLDEFRNATESLKAIYPEGGYTLQGNGAVFGGLGMALAIYSCAKPKKKKLVAGILIPATLTSMFIGITEPLDFTFLFVAPVLWVIHAALSAIMSMVMYQLGVVGNFGNGLIDWVTQNWIPMFNNHSEVMFTQILVGLTFSGIYFLVFRTLILKFNFATIGRGNDEDVQSDIATQSEAAGAYLELLGGVDNVKSCSHCMTRLRVQVIDVNKVSRDTKSYMVKGAKGVSYNGNEIQVICGPGIVENVYADFKLIIE